MLVQAIVRGRVMALALIAPIARHSRSRQAVVATQKVALTAPRLPVAAATPRGGSGRGSAMNVSSGRAAAARSARGRASMASMGPRGGGRPVLLGAVVAEVAGGGVEAAPWWWRWWTTL